MTIAITWPMILALITGVPGVCGVVVYILRTYTRGYDWVKHQAEQDDRIKELEKKHNDEIKTVKRELKALTKAMLACLQGLHEQGCNGPVTKAIDDLQEHINNRAHE